MSANLNIAALTRRTGISPDTIRKWEQRYAVLQPSRTPGGQRRYSELDVARIEWLKARIHEGYRIGEATTLLGSGYPVVAGTATEIANALVEATVRADVNGLARLVDQALSGPSLEDAFSQSLAPALTEVGSLWAGGKIGVAQEHLASGTVRAALQKLLSDPRGGLRGTAVLACAPGEQHEIGLLMLAALLRADGWQVAYLGPDTPPIEALSLAIDVGARAVCFSATVEASAKELERELAANDAPHDISVLVGGAAAPTKQSLRSTVTKLRKLAA
jgi:MerR family transcriptional regulator, light-induced transcriptional regulator